MRRSVFVRWAGAATCLAVGLACGGEDPVAGDPAQAVSEREANQAPLIERLRFEPAEPMPGDRVRAVATVRDPDGDRSTQRFRWEVAGRELGEDGPEIALADAVKGDRVEVWVTASDGRAESEPAHAAASVANRRPVLENVALQPAGSVLPGELAQATPVARDPDGDTLEFRFRWTVNDKTLEEQQEASLPTDGLAANDRIRVEVVASDGDSESDPAWSGILIVGNGPPEIASSPSGVGPGQIFRYSVDARDPEGDKSLRYQLRKGPEGMTIDAIVGEVHWQPRADQAGTHPVEIVVEDSRGARSVQVFELTVGSPPATPPPAAPPE